MRKMQCENGLSALVNKSNLAISSRYVVNLVRSQVKSELFHIVYICLIGPILTFALFESWANYLLLVGHILSLLSLLLKFKSIIMSSRLVLKEISKLESPSSFKVIKIFIKHFQEHLPGLDECVVA